MAKILLVEDDNNLREIYEARLMAEGYDIVSARDGEEALTVAMKERPDLIISDVMMPKISGFDMLDIIRSTEETKNAKVIMMTALSQAEDKERATKLGADRYLVKSQVTLEDVAKVAREVLAGDSAGSATQASEPAAKPPAVTQALTTPTPEPVTTPASDPVPVIPSPVVAQTTVQPAPEPSTTTQPVSPPPNDDEQAEPPSTPSSGQQAVSPEAPNPTPTPVVAQTTTASTTVTPTEVSGTDTENVAPTTQSVASEAMEAIMPDSVKNTDAATSVTPQQPIEDEQSAIAAQIESFIETSKTGDTEAKVMVESTPPLQTPSQPTEENPVVEQPSEEKPEAEKVKKKVIHPISDPTASKGPDLDSLLKKEEEKQEMQEIAKSVAAQKSEVADERIAEAALVKAAANHTSSEDSSDNSEAPQVAISEDGDLKITSEPEAVVPEPAQATPDSEAEVQTPVIPHQNGNNMDGVVAQPQTTAPPQQEPQTDQPVQPPAQPPQQSVNDPNSIAL